MLDLAGKTGIITGASGGIGFATAEILAEAGATVYAFSRSGAPKEGVSHPNVHHQKVDINDYAATKAAVDAIGRLDFVVNNAGITIKKRAEDFTMEEFEQVMKTNVSSMVHMCKICYPYLKQAPHRGRIVCISSMAAHLGFSQVVPYCVSKSAVLGVVHGLCVEWAQDRININSVAPGWIPSEMSKQVLNADPERKSKILGRMPRHAFGEQRDIGSMVLYLVADESEYITGQDFAVDGGALAFGF